MMDFFVLVWDWCTDDVDLKGFSPVFYVIARNEAILFAESLSVCNSEVALFLTMT
ncbi:hypothetical protein SAMN04487979_10221 [Flavobacterium sp. ov086]|nr:hypothetical protein SAMN04487979_10221 [Flavobacterium sp. ov086]